MPKPKFSTILSLLIFGLIIVTAINYHKNNVLESKINTLGKSTSQSKNADIQKFKEDYYITQQGKDTDLLLFVFGLSVTIMGVLTYHNIVTKFEDKIAEVKNEFEDYKNDWKDTQETLNELRVHFYIDSVQLSKELAETHFSKREVKKHLTYTLRATAKYADLIKFVKEVENETDKDETELIESFTKNVVALLSTLNVNIGNGESLKFNSNERNLLEIDIENTRTIPNVNINRFLSDIHVKINPKKGS